MIDAVVYAGCLSSDSLNVPRMLGAFAVEVVDGSFDGAIELVEPPVAVGIPL